MHQIRGNSGAARSFPNKLLVSQHGGVRYDVVYAYTQSMVLRSASGTMRIVDAYHPIDKLRVKELLPEQVVARPGTA